MIQCTNLKEEIKWQQQSSYANDEKSTYISSVIMQRSVWYGDKATHIIKGTKSKGRLYISRA